MQRNIRYIAVDDNPVDLLILEEYAKAFDFFEPVGFFKNPAEALNAVDRDAPDLIFLDIDMPGLSGLELLRQLKQQVPIVVFITAHAEYALEGFEVSALDFILKPLSAERFSMTAARVLDYWNTRQKAAAYEVLVEQEFLVIKEGHTWVRLPREEIIYLEAMQDYTKVVTQHKNYLTLTTLTAFLDKLSRQHFLRVHRSYAVAINKIRELHANKLVCGNTVIPIGKTYRTAVSMVKL